MFASSHTSRYCNQWSWRSHFKYSQHRLFRSRRRIPPHSSRHGKNRNEFRIGLLIRRFRAFENPFEHGSRSKNSEIISSIFIQSYEHKRRTRYRLRKNCLSRQKAEKNLITDRKPLKTNTEVFDFGCSSRAQARLF